MTTEATEGNEPDSRPDARRRQLNVAVLAALAGGLGMATTAQAFPRSAKGQFNAASRILAPYGVAVGGDDAGGHDRLDFEIAPLDNTEYTQVVGDRNRLGEIEPRWMTSVFGADASATHFHTRTSGEIVPCVKTRIENNESLATHEVFDVTEGDIIPCIKVATEMREGGELGDVRIDIDPALASVNWSLATMPGLDGVGAKTYDLRSGHSNGVGTATLRVGVGNRNRAVPIELGSEL